MIPSLLMNVLFLLLGKVISYPWSVNTPVDTLQSILSRREPGNVVVSGRCVAKIKNIPAYRAFKTSNLTASQKRSCSLKSFNVVT